MCRSLVGIKNKSLPILAQRNANVVKLGHGDLE